MKKRIVMIYVHQSISRIKDKLLGIHGHVAAVCYRCIKISKKESGVKDSCSPLDWC